MEVDQIGRDLAEFLQRWPAAAVKARVMRGMARRDSETVEGFEPTDQYTIVIEVNGGCPRVRWSEEPDEDDRATRSIAARGISVGKFLRIGPARPRLGHERPAAK